MEAQLIFYVNLNTGKRRLYIPKSIMGKIFKIAHDDAFNIGYHRVFSAISEGLYIRRLIDHLKQYIKCCFECRLNRTTQYALYGNIIAITLPTLPFYNLCINFIVAFLPSEPRLFNSILTVIDKFTKGKLLIPGRDNMSAQNWAVQLLDYLRLCNWGIPKATINNRNSKFRLE